MINYWFEFDLTLDDNPQLGTLLGVGITTNSKDRALLLLKKKVFKGALPRIIKTIEGVNIEDLDENHVKSNMADIDIEGIWYPLGFQ